MFVSSPSALSFLSLLAMMSNAPDVAASYQRFSYRRSPIPGRVGSGQMAVGSEERTVCIRYCPLPTAHCPLPTAHCFSMPRFVVLEHDWPSLHWDFLLEAGEVLLAWRLLEEPATGQDVRA